MDCKGASLQVI